MRFATWTKEEEERFGMTQKEMERNLERLGRKEAERRERDREKEEEAAKKYWEEEEKKRIKAGMKIYRGRKKQKLSGERYNISDKGTIGTVLVGAGILAAIAYLNRK